MKKVFLILFLLNTISLYSREYITLEEVTLSDSLTQFAVETIIEQRPQCFSFSVPYYVVDYCPATLGEDEFHLIIYPADLTAVEMHKLKYFFVIRNVQFVLSRDTPEWFFCKKNTTKQFAQMFDKEREEQELYEQTKQGIAPPIDDREFIRATTRIWLKGVGHSVMWPYICSCEIK